MTSLLMHNWCTHTPAHSRTHVDKEQEREQRAMQGEEHRTHIEHEILFTPKDLLSCWFLGYSQVTRSCLAEIHLSRCSYVLLFLFLCFRCCFIRFFLPARLFTWKCQFRSAKTHYTTHCQSQSVCAYVCMTITTTWWTLYPQVERSDIEKNGLERKCATSFFGIVSVDKVLSLRFVDTWAHICT